MRTRREFLAGVAGIGAAVALGGCSQDTDAVDPAPSSTVGSSQSDPGGDRTSTTKPVPPPEPKVLTGVDMDSGRRWRVAGTDLGIPYVIDRETVGFLFGDLHLMMSKWSQDEDGRSLEYHVSHLVGTV